MRICSIRAAGESRSGRCCVRMNKPDCTAPGHNSFTVSEDGADDILVFHARTYKEIAGDPLYDPNRHTFIRKIRWTADGMPDSKDKREDLTEKSREAGNSPGIIRPA